jgi:hypothetical protein
VREGRGETRRDERPRDKAEEFEGSEREMRRCKEGRRQGYRDSTWAGVEKKNLARVKPSSKNVSNTTTAWS